MEDYVAVHALTIPARGGDATWVYARAYLALRGQAGAPDMRA